jgi:hypothetical protein
MVLTDKQIEEILSKIPTPKLVRVKKPARPPAPPKPAAVKAEERWHRERSVLAVIADTLVHTQALLARLEGGVTAPNDSRRAHYETAVRDLYLQTQRQLTALAACAKLKALE